MNRFKNVKIRMKIHREENNYKTQLTQVNKRRRKNRNLNTARYNFGYRCFQTNTEEDLRITTVIKSHTKYTKYVINVHNTYLFFYCKP